MRDARRTGRTSCPPGTQIALPQPPVLPRRPREASASFPRLTPPRSNSGIAVAFEARFGRPPYNALVLARHCWPGVESEAPRSTALWEPASASHRLPAPGSCARPVPATPKLRPMDAERSGRPGEPPAPTAGCRRPSPGGQALAVSAAAVTDHVRDRWQGGAALSGIGFPVGGSALPASDRDPRNLQRSRRRKPTEIPRRVAA